MHMSKAPGAVNQNRIGQVLYENHVILLETSTISFQDYEGIE